MNILEACRDPNLFKPWFTRDSWAPWLAFLSPLFALPMTPEQETIYKSCTGRTTAPSSMASEGWLIVGRRGGKSFILALVAVYLACFKEYRQYLAPGEIGTVMVIATDRKQSRIILRYIGALLGVPLLRSMVTRENRESFELSNFINIEVATASFKSTRGYAIIAALCDELAFWPQENSAEPDYEILTALRPGMAQFPNSLLLCASSPYAQRGALFEAHRNHYGKDGDPILIWQAATKTMNPTISQRTVDEACERDPASAQSEWLALFRTDISNLVSRTALAACVSQGIYERAPVGTNTYQAFVDPSGGSSDSFTLGIGHRDGDIAVLDCIREIKPPFSPEAATLELANVLRSYNIKSVTGDRYGGEWPREAFRRYGINYNISEMKKSEIYLAALPLINSKRADLLDDPRLLNQFAGLERRTSRGGRDTVDHGPHSHDDLANAAAGVLCLSQVPAARASIGYWDCYRTGNVRR